MFAAGVILIALVGGAAYAVAWVVAQAALSEADASEYGAMPWLHPEMLGGETASGIAGGGGGLRKADRLDRRTQRTDPFRTMGRSAD